MTMFCKREDLTNESDVEQKLLAPLLFTDAPRGLGYSTVDVRTKADIRFLLIGKGQTQKRYHPDYVVLIAGIPVLIIEAKTPGEDLVEALREARLYAAELNSLFPPGLNPCCRVMAADGMRLVTSCWDTAAVDAEVAFEELDVANPKCAAFAEKLSKKWAVAAAEAVLKRLNKPQFTRPLHLLGGSSVRDEAVGYNTFGATIAFEYRHLFNPSTRDDREFIARNAYIDSPRRSRYMNPLSQLIKAAVPPPVCDLTEVDSSTATNPLIDRLRAAKTLEHQVLLLVGSVGSGKSTFVDRLQAVTLPEDVKRSTVWVRMNLNEAPMDPASIYTWVKARLIEGLREAEEEIDFDTVETMNKVYSVEVRAFKKGPISLLDASSNDYKIRLVDELQRLQRDDLGTARAMTRYVCQERRRALIVVMDNCDKGRLEEQLLMFQVAQWVREQFRCLVFLPIRDVTYDLYRERPPLDTALKDMVFRIDPPLFSDVLEKRILLAIQQMAAKGSKKLPYTLRNGVRVEYPASDQGMYMVSILESLLEHDRFIRRTITALAGKDVRRAMEIFLEFCNSGHISEGDIFQIRAQRGQYVLPYHVVARVLLRMNRRFYSGDQSYLCNILQCRPQDARPDHLVRVAVLRWLQQNIRKPGPTGVKGYHQCWQLVYELVPFGHNADRVRDEILYLAQKGCIFTEHQRTDVLAEEDLITISPAGWVHLELLSNIDYVSACAEDLWFGDRQAAERVAQRIGSGGIEQHFCKKTLVENANEVCEYLGRYEVKVFREPEVVLEGGGNPGLHSLEDMEREIAEQASSFGRGKAWLGVDQRYPKGSVMNGTVTAVKEFGVFVELEPGVEGLLHKSRIPCVNGTPRKLTPRERVQVRIYRVHPKEYKIDLELADGG